MVTILSFAERRYPQEECGRSAFAVDPRQLDRRFRVVPVRLFDQ